MGIGSTACVALREGRNVIGFELKESYHAQALANVKKWREDLRKDQADAMPLLTMSGAA